MKIKKFQGRSFKEVLEMVKKELGSDAIVISSISKKDPISGDSYIELTAAVDDEVSTSEILKDRLQTEEIYKINSTVFKEIEKLKAEVSLLRESIIKLFFSLDDSSKRRLYSFLIKNSIEPYFALVLLEKAKDMNELRTAIETDVKTCKTCFDEESGFIFYGLPGVGKTCTVFKIGEVFRSNNEIMIISLDQRVGSIAYIEELALKLKCEVKLVKELKELYRIIHKEVDKKKILIDTPGDVNIRLAEELKSLLKDVPIKKCLLMDASMLIQSNLRAIKTFDSDAVDCISFSKIDLAQTYGNLYNLSVLSGKPVSFITSGGYGEKNAKIFSPNTISNLILGGACES